MNGMCQMKYLDGWRREQSDTYDSGVKGQTFVEVGTHLHALSDVGNYVCDQKTTVYDKKANL